MRVILAVLLLLIVGCSKMEMARMQKQTDADVITMVNRYRQAGTAEVETVLKDYLTLADDYERKGWARYGAPGWIDDLRGLCEARLAVFHKAVGNTEAYQIHVHRAIEHLKRVHPDVAYTEQGVCVGVMRLDDANIQPRWRKELSKRTPPDQSFVGKTVAEFLDHQRIALDDCRFVDEPPGVLRELSVPATKQGRWLRVVLKREPSLFSEQRQWSPDAVRPTQIVEVRYADH